MPQPFDLTQLFTQIGESLGGQWPSIVFMVSGKKIADGNVYWDTNPKPDFLIPRNKEPVRTALIEADALRKKYAYNQYAHLSASEIEELKVSELMGILEKAIGPYNPRVAAEDTLQYARHVGNGELEKQMLVTLKSLQGKYLDHDDWQRSNSDFPASLDQFAHGETNCRHRGALFSMLATQAGISNCVASGYYSDEGKPRADHHLWVVSLDTAHIIDPSFPRDTAYRKNISGVNVTDMATGKSVVTVGKNGGYASYGFGYMGMPAQDRIIEQRKNILLGRSSGTMQVLPAPDRKDLVKFDSAQIRLHREKNQAAQKKEQAKPPQSEMPLSAIDVPSSVSNMAHLAEKFHAGYNPVMPEQPMLLADTAPKGLPAKNTSTYRT